MATLSAIKLVKTSQCQFGSMSPIYFPANCGNNTKSYNRGCYFVVRQTRSAYYFWDGLGSQQATNYDGTKYYQGVQYGNTAYSGTLSPMTKTLDEMMGTTLWNPGTDSTTAWDIQSAYASLISPTLNQTTGGTVSITNPSEAVTVDDRSYYDANIVTAKASASTNYSFIRWSDGSTSNTKSLSANDVASAIFGAKFTVVFNKNADDATGSMSNQAFVNGVSQNLTSNAFARSGYTFAGWSRSSGGSVAYYDGQDANTASTTAGATVTLYAVWTGVQYNVAFDTNGGSGSVAARTVNYGDGSTCPSYTGTKTRCTFLGWSTSSSATTATYVSGSRIDTLRTTSGTTTLYAVWQPTRHTITVNNPKSGVANIVVTCDSPSMSQTITGSTGTFTAQEGSTYRIEVQYKDGESHNAAYNAKKYTAANFTDEDGDAWAVTKSGTSYYFNYTSDQGEPTTFTAVFNTNAEYTITPSVVCRIGTQPLVTLSPAHDGDTGWFSQDITIAYDLRGNDAVTFQSWVASKNGTPYAQYNPNDASPMVFALSGDTDLVVTFAVKTCTASVEVHSLSTSGGSASVSVQQYQSGTTHYGDTATYTATPNSGYQFAGWYLADGTPAPDSSDGTNTYRYTDATYKKVLSGDFKLYAKFAAPLTVRIGHDAGAVVSGMVYIGEIGNASSYTEHVTLGETKTIKATTENYFAGWYDGASPSFATDIPLDVDQEDSVVVTGPKTYTAYLVSAAQFNYLALYGFDIREGVETWGNVCSWALNNGTLPVGVTALTMAEYIDATGHTNIPTTGSFYKVIGVKRLRLTATATGSQGFYDAKKYSADDITSGSLPSTALETKTVSSFYTVVNSDIAFVGRYGTPAQKYVTIEFATNSYATMGELELSGGTATASGGKTAQFAQGSSCTVSAQPKNGYRLAGWYEDAAHTILASSSKNYTFTVQGTTMLYARFEQDLNAVYKWAGSTRTKTMMWKSKMYKSTVPFAPSVARVLSLGYPMTLTVGMHSAPDADAVRNCTIHVGKQDVRRLALMRPEMYLQMSLQSGSEVDEVSVGTSMGGLRA